MEMQMFSSLRSCPRPGLALGLGVLLLGAGCATAGRGPPRPPSEEEVRSLEERVSRDSSDLGSLVALASAYRRQQRPDAARPVLERAVTHSPRDAEAVALLALTYEDLGLFGEAIDRYEAYLRIGRDPMLRQQFSGRMSLLRRRQLAAAARSALQREAALASTPPQTGTVAVFPFLLQTPQPELAPLGVALADLLVTDLSRTSRLRVLERITVQSLLDEIQLAETGLVDPATAARGGRLLGAAHVVQGSVGGTEEALQLRAAVVGVGAQPQGQGSPLQEQDALVRLFDMQKRLALGIYRSLGIELTPAEREQVNRRPTENVQALLAYGAGLEAEDAGDFVRAQQFFARAVALDPGFAEARQRRETAERAARAAAVSTAQLAQLAGAADPSGALAAAEALVPSGAGRDAVPEFLGREGIGPRGAVVRIILP